MIDISREVKDHTRLCLLLLGLGGCGRPGRIAPAVVLPVVNVAGSEVLPNGSTGAVTWRNGVIMALNDLGKGSYATSLAVQGNDLYVAGVEGNGSQDIALYWKNDASKQLTDGTKRGFANGIFVVGSDVYVAGAEDTTAMYWKNGVARNLSDGVEPAMAYSVTVATNGDVYVSGYQYKTTAVGANSFVVNPVATYWKNGVGVALTDGLRPSEAYALSMSGSDVYVAGYQCPSTLVDCSRASYWKNGVLNQLGDEPASTATSVVASGSSVYVTVNQALISGGVAKVRAAYWHDQVEATLSESIGASTSQVVISGGDVYIAGSDSGSAGYWVNGVPVPLSSDSQSARGSSIVVAK